MKNIFWLFVAMLVVISSTSCKLEQKINPDDNKPAVGPLKVSDARNFTNSELQISRRLCSNLKNKREFFEKLTNEKEQIRMRAELRNCDNFQYNSDLFDVKVSNASSSGLEYIAVFGRDTYLRDVITEQTAVLKQMCDSVVVSDAVSNTVTTNTLKYTVNFLITEGYDGYEIVKSQKNAQGGYTPISGESVAVFSSNTQVPQKFLGVEKERARYTMCDTIRYSTIKQSWVQALTNF